MVRRFNFRSSQIWRPCCAVMPRSHAGDIQNRSGKAKDYLRADLAEAKGRCQAIAAGIIGELGDRRLLSTGTRAFHCPALSGRTMI